jgi:Mce-associated membrane protein
VGVENGVGVGLPADHRTRGVPAALPLPAMEREPPRSKRRRRVPWLRVVTAALTAIAFAALLAAGWYGVAWYRAANDPGQASAIMRDEVLAEAHQIVMNLEAVSYDTLEADLDRWESSITGPLLDDFRNSRAQYAEQISRAQSRAEPKIVDVAVTELDPAAGTAKALVFVDLTVIEHRDGAETGRATKRQRIRLDLIRTEQGWKASAAGPIGSA